MLCANKSLQEYVDRRKPKVARRMEWARVDLLRGHISAFSFVIALKGKLQRKGDFEMEARIKDPAMLVPGAMEAMQSLAKVAHRSTVPSETLSLVHLRASQINGCSVCVDLDFRSHKASERDERLFAVAAWRDAPYFSDAERAALALAEAVTRLSDRSDPVPDEIWNEASRHYDQAALASLVLWIGVTNLWNRLNVATKQVAGEWAKTAEAKKIIENIAAD